MRSGVRWPRSAASFSRPSQSGDALRAFSIVSVDGTPPSGSISRACGTPFASHVTSYSSRSSRWRLHGTRVSSRLSPSSTPYQVSLTCHLDCGGAGPASGFPETGPRALVEVRLTASFAGNRRRKTERYVVISALFLVGPSHQPAEMGTSRKRAVLGPRRRWLRGTTVGGIKSSDLPASPPSVDFVKAFKVTLQSRSYRR